MRRLTVMALFASVIALTPLQAGASEPAPPSVETDATPPAPSAAAPSPGTPLALKTDGPSASPRSSGEMGIATKVGACALILGAAAWAFKRRRNASKTDLGAKGSLALLSRLSLGARTEVCVIEVDGQRLVIGVTPQNISTLSVAGLESTLAEPEPIAAAPRLADMRDRSSLSNALPQDIDGDDRAETSDEEPRLSRREINQTGVQRIARAPHEGLLRLFERTRSLTRNAPADEMSEAAPAPERERDRRAGRDIERNAEPEERPNARRNADEAPRARAASARASVEGQARGLAALRAKR